MLWGKENKSILFCFNKLDLKKFINEVKVKVDLWG